MPELDEKARSAVQYIRSISSRDIRYGIVLGSGLGSVADLVGNPLVIPYNKIPGFPVPTVEGHKGNLVIGRLGGVDVAVMQGRYHYYEGYYMKEVTMQVRVLAGLGVHTLIVTNASGGVRPDLNPGDMLSVTDHINMMGVNPLVGMDEKGGATRFVDMTRAYDAALIDTVMEVSGELGMVCKTGVIAAVSGPCYETPAEVRMLGMMGADAVCMSTVPEVIMARYMGMKVAGLSLVTNRAAGLSISGPSHAEVLDTARRYHEGFSNLVAGVLERLG